VGRGTDIRSSSPPAGRFVHTPAGEVVYDPDEQVQHVVRLIFRKFDELGTLHALLRYLRQHNITVGVRLREGPAKGTLEWRRPNRMTLQNMLKHPLYAGAYAYGRRQVDPRKKQPGRPSTGRVMRPCHAYHAFLKEHVPAYITWAQYERNLARLEANRARAETIGAVRHGPSLLAGLVVCGLCGRRMQVRYGGPNTLHSYTCNRLATDYGGDYCQYLPGEPVDAFVRGFGGCATTHAEGTGTGHAFLAILSRRPWVVVTVPTLVLCARLLGWSREEATTSLVTGSVLIPFGRLHTSLSLPPPTAVLHLFPATGGCHDTPQRLCP
jgi:Recombinase/Recombinase zinc beta ribbon domain